MSYLERLRRAYDILFCNEAIEELKQANADRTWLLTENDRLRKENWKLRCIIDTTPVDGDYGYSEYCDFIDEGQ
jgi:hypothetical protein